MKKSLAAIIAILAFTTSFAARILLPMGKDVQNGKTTHSFFIGDATGQILIKTATTDTIYGSAASTSDPTQALKVSVLNPGPALWGDSIVCIWTGIRTGTTTDSVYGGIQYRVRDSVYQFVGTKTAGAFTGAYGTIRVVQPLYWNRLYRPYLYGATATDSAYVVNGVCFIR